MKNTIAGYTKESYMNKEAGIDFNVSSWADTGKALMFLLTGASAVAGYAAGKVYQKATEPTDTDFDNAQRSYDVGAMKASLRRQAQRLTQERSMASTDPSKSMRLV